MSMVVVKPKRTLPPTETRILQELSGHQAEIIKPKPERSYERTYPAITHRPDARVTFTVHPDLAYIAEAFVPGGGTRGPSSRPQTPTPFPHLCSSCRLIEGE